MNKMNREQIKFFSTNINRLNSPQKRKRTFTQLKKLKADIIFLQETHIRTSDRKYLQQDKLGKLFTANEKSKKKREVATYVKEWLNPKLIYKDEDARIIMVEVQSGQQKILIINIYAQNEGQKVFSDKLYIELQKFNYQDLLIIGDFNAVFDRKQGKSSTRKKEKTVKIIPNPFLCLAEETYLIGAWRTKYPNTKDLLFTQT